MNGWHYMDIAFYEIINDAANKVFFDGQSQGLPVYLDMEDEEKEGMALELAESPDEIESLLGEAVSETLLLNEVNIYKIHLENFKRWHSNDFLSPPPFTALLLSLSLAAEHMRKDGEFTANNYYQRLGEVFGINNEAHIEKIRVSGKHTKIFWQALNLWLRSSDYAYGKPTAKKVNNWTYVSFAISQSLVRDVDRISFHEMFSHYGLSSRDHLGDSELKLYLHEWMSTSSPSNWLKSLWGKEDLRARVISSVQSELEMWNGASNIEGGIQKRLTWLMVHKTFPRFKSNLFLSTSEIDNHDVGGISIDDDCCDVAKSAFEKGVNYWMAPKEGTEMICIDPSNKLLLASPLLSNIRFINSDQSVRLTHEAKPVIPLLRVECRSFYREVSRTSLFLEHTIICHEKWKDRVINYLERYAREGYSILDNKANTGLPDQWVLIRNVNIVLVARDGSCEQLDCLVPLSEGSNIHLSSGLKLGSGIWHAMAPPQVFATDNQGLIGAQLITDKLEPQSQCLHLEECNGIYNPGFLAEINYELLGGDFSIQGIKNNKSVVEKNISFRSADIPRKFIVGKDSAFAYVIDHESEKGWGLSATPKNQIQTSEDTIEGMLISSKSLIHSMNSNQEELKSLANSYSSEETQGVSNLTSLTGGSDSCIIRGYHIWHCHTDNGPGTHTSREMTCTGCGKTQMARPSTRVKTNTVVNDVEQLNISISEGVDEYIDADIVYDAICYIGSGTWAKLESILSSHVESPWEVYEFSRNLVDLGLIEIEMNDKNTRARYWSCSPPCFVVNADMAYLSGFRNKCLVDEVELKLAGVSSLRTIKKGRMVPTSFRWNIGNKSLDEIKELLGTIRDPFGRAIKVINAPGVSMLLMLPNLNKIIPRLPTITIDRGHDVETFDLLTGKWGASSLNGAGAYRINFAGRRYFYHDTEGQSYEATHELVKLIHAKSEGFYLHGYDHNATCFESLIGCTPPGLYRRALVSLTGVLPKLSDRKISYSNVSSDFASLMLNKLYK